LVVVIDKLADLVKLHTGHNTSWWLHTLGARDFYASTPLHLAASNHSRIPVALPLH